MPRNVSGVMSWPAGTTATTNTTISSADYNAFLADLLSDLNAARPIVAGGTGATTAKGALDSLFAQGDDIASASTTDLSTATGNYVNITGTTTITAFGTVSAGSIRILRFSDALTLTHNATSLILPGGANVTTAAGDVFAFVSEGSGNWRCVGYALASGEALVSPTVDPLFLTERSAPSTSADQGALYTKDSGGQPELFYREESDGDEVQVTKDGKINAPLTQFFESAEQTITSGGSLTLAHGLSSAPKLIQLYLKCKTADIGYSVGDEVAVNNNVNKDEGSANYGTSVHCDASNVNIRYGSASRPYYIIRADNGNASIITNASWKLIVRAWA